LHHRRPTISRGTAALERGKPTSPEAETLRGSRRDELRWATTGEGRVGEACERRRREIDAAPVEGESPGGTKAQESIEAASRWKHGASPTDSLVEQDPEGERRIGNGATTNVKRVEGADEASRLPGRERL
jgi:hypothetical protein